jgi:hypothetical protein
MKRTQLNQQLGAPNGGSDGGGDGEGDLDGEESEGRAEISGGLTPSFSGAG